MGIMVDFSSCAHTYFLPRTLIKYKASLAPNCNGCQKFFDMWCWVLDDVRMVNSFENWYLSDGVDGDAIVFCCKFYFL